MGRLEGKVAIVVGAGQTPGETIGNGRATALLFAREGASVLAVDRNLESAVETVARIEAEGGTAAAVEADATRETDCEAFIAGCRARYGRIDILHNNVGIGGGDAGPAHLREADWDRILAVNLKSVILPCKHVLPVMREQQSGSIINISSIAAVCATGIVAYKVSKAGVNAYTQTLAIGNAKHGIRANVIMPGLMNTPMAIEGISSALGIDREKLIEQCNAQVPLGGKMGTAWDVAYAALFLASDESAFVTGVVLPVDGGQSARIG
ncbi:MAG: SDR family NAD(P)-dependent oxidoreductase [Proteobacteria bacterium]|nr:SDR family NAD(P)-dependent oxidoreductase [Pseudomonadota bacterium]